MSSVLKLERKKVTVKLKKSSGCDISNHCMVLAMEHQAWCMLSVCSAIEATPAHMYLCLSGTNTFHLKVKELHECL